VDILDLSAGEIREDCVVDVHVGCSYVRL
jgi:hypothetical protein